ncbi:MAG: hypothetical protein WCZ66_00085 [Sphingomonadaceae bacterium]
MVKSDGARVADVDGARSPADEGPGIIGAGPAAVEGVVVAGAGDAGLAALAEPSDADSWAITGVDASKAIAAVAQRAASLTGSKP